MMFIAAVAVDPDAREIYTVDNDIGDRMMVFSYDANGNVKPLRALSVPHQAWGLRSTRRARKSPSASRGHARSSSTRRMPADRMLRSG